ncbi:MAG TPA: hypothetical protein VMT37_09835 [Solirubrobacterales bacterium]|nr:hypothetical protein [Solirubrobacterales bacterium]
MRNRARATVLALVLIMIAIGAVDALAAPAPGAHARRPSYDASALELVGKGGYRAPQRAQLKLTVCLRKKIGKRSFDVRCESAEARGKLILAQVSVPGCVAGVWRTTASAEAIARDGTVLGSDSDVSRPFRCRS